MPRLRHKADGAQSSWPLLSPKSAALAAALRGTSRSPRNDDDDDATALGYLSDGDGTAERRVALLFCAARVGLSAVAQFGERGQRRQQEHQGQEAGRAMRGARGRLR